MATYSHINASSFKELNQKVTNFADDLRNKVVDIDVDRLNYIYNNVISNDNIITIEEFKKYLENEN